MKKKAALIILDGLGYAPDSEYNAVTQANTPYLDTLFKENSFALLKDYGKCVGLPEFQTGGSEVGHITIGAGREIPHLLTKINEKIESGEFSSNKKLQKIFETAKKNNRIHLIGMISDGGIHSFQPHLYGLMKMAKSKGIENIFLHCFTDGRDVGERTVLKYLSQIEEKKIGKISSLGGRFFAMDRDNNCERIQEMYNVMTNRNLGEKNILPEKYIENFYKTSKKSDYYLPPVCFCEEGKIFPEDVVINFNFRVDRSRQISEKLCDTILRENYSIFGPYCDGAIEPFDFGDISVKNSLGEILEKNNKTQLRISETEKFNHVTYYISGQRKEKFEGEVRILVPSPKCISYAEKPEMSAGEQMQACIDFVKEKSPDCIIQNYANPDLVGHSGDFEAAKKAIEVVDKCLSEQIPFLQNLGYEVFITADHGNADSMKNHDGTPNASHTKAPVPFVWVSQAGKKLVTNHGTLQDIAPTILTSMELKIPKEMTGKNLVS